MTFHRSWYDVVSIPYAYLAQVWCRKLAKKEYLDVQEGKKRYWLDIVDRCFSKQSKSTSLYEESSAKKLVSPINVWTQSDVADVSERGDKKKSTKS